MDKDQPRPQPFPVSKQHLYDEDYFLGRTSGYPPEGYRVSHPDWSAWLGLLGLVRPGPVLIDVGCAYGYLVGEARGRGYCAFGADISTFALGQEPGFRPWLVQAGAERLPFKDAAADIVTLFDVLEHLERPEMCLEEVLRVLKPNGLVVGATPDPVFFDRHEATHCSERPPSYWVRILENLGLEVHFRFSEAPYNFQFLAAPRGAPVSGRLSIFQHDYFEEGRQDIVAARGTPPLHVCPRAGWGPLTPGGRALQGASASIYLLNNADTPVHANFKIHLAHTPGFSTLRVRFNSYVLEDVFIDSEQVDRTLQLDDVIIPSGGHHLSFDLFPGGPTVTIQSVDIDTKPVERSALTVSLPFDLFQRYRLCSDIVGILLPRSILDIGGYLGDEYGHLAIPHDFLAEEGGAVRLVRCTDVRQCDHPDALKAAAWAQPFSDGAFDLVLSLDVLEHLDPDRRSHFLKELDRLSTQWIVLGAPFAAPEIEEAESDLAESLMGARRFLEEHRRLGLPEPSLVEGFFGARGYHLLRLPNGFLSRWRCWQAATQHFFGFNDYQVIRKFNTLYNSRCYADDNRAPAYRSIYVISKSPWNAVQEAALGRLALPPSPAGESSCTEEAAADPGFLEILSRAALLLDRRQKALSDCQFLINERQKLIGHLRRELEETPVWRQILRRVRRKG